MIGTSIRMPKVRNWTLWMGRLSGENQGLGIVEGSAPYETEKEPTSNVSTRRAGNVAAPATWDNFAPPFRKKKITLNDGEKPYHGAARDWRT
jgi:hypothetical protein